jgi:hypothetical protein
MPDPSALTDEGLPPLFHEFDTEAIKSQNRHVSSVRIQLIGLAGAAVFGALVIDGTAAGPVFALCAAACFAIAFGVRIFTEFERDEARWYEARAAAESTKTLAWRFAVGGNPYPTNLPANEAKRALLERFKAISGALEYVGPVVGSERKPAITEAMSNSRSESLGFRRSSYLLHRIDAQAAWYENKAKWNRKRARTWLAITLATEFLGIFVGLARAAGWLQVDALGIVAAVAAGFGAWVATKQYRNLAVAYSLTGRELKILTAEVPDDLNEEEWANFVDQSEEAISREHTMWLASRSGRTAG